MSGDWPCHRCGTDNVIAILSFPHTCTNASGDRIPVVSELHLCANCDADDSLAGPVARHLTVDPSAHPDNVDPLANALLRWISQAQPPQPDEDALHTEIDAYHRG